jgi:hypothetical protein
LPNPKDSKPPLELTGRTVAMKVLIIGPAFFDYTKAIAVEINSREVYAFVFNELHSETILSKIAYRLKLDFLFNLKVKKYSQVFVH